MGEVQELGVIGIGMGGPEQHFPPEPYRDVYERARELGFQDHRPRRRGGRRG